MFTLGNTKNKTTTTTTENAPMRTPEMPYKEKLLLLIMNFVISIVSNK